MVLLLPGHPVYGNCVAKGPHAVVATDVKVALELGQADDVALAPEGVDEALDTDELPDWACAAQALL